jgi:hypothetical protein
METNNIFNNKLMEFKQEVEHIFPQQQKLHLNNYNKENIEIMSHQYSYFQMVKMEVLK